MSVAVLHHPAPLYGTAEQPPAPHGFDVRIAVGRQDIIQTVKVLAVRNRNVNHRVVEAGVSPVGDRNRGVAVDEQCAAWLSPCSRACLVARSAG